MNSTYGSYLTPFSMHHRFQSVEYNTTIFQLGYELDAIDIHYSLAPFAKAAGQSC
jgi:hypothetical protein